MQTGVLIKLHWLRATNSVWPTQVSAREFQKLLEFCGDDILRDVEVRAEHRETLSTECLEGSEAICRHHAGRHAVNSLASICLAVSLGTGCNSRCCIMSHHSRGGGSLCKVLGPSVGLGMSQRLVDVCCIEACRRPLGRIILT